jgi:hypothetical protein
MAIRDRSLGPPVDRLRRRLYPSPRRVPVEQAIGDGTEMSDQSRRQPTRPSDLIEPVKAKAANKGTWTEYLVLFLRIMAVLSLAKGLYHWSQVCSIGAAPGQAFEMHTLAWQSATVFFAVIDLVAAVGLWLAAAWGAVVWLTATVSMAVVELFFPGIYGGSVFIVLTEMGLLGVYLWLAIFSAREKPA